MNTINIVLMVVLVAILSLIFGYSMGVTEEKKKQAENSQKGLENLKKFADAMKELSEKNKQEKT